jgi:small subunit ribosomal protein S9
VVLTRGPGRVTINGKNIQDYFGDIFFRVEALKPLIFTSNSGQYNLKFSVYGGGQKGQSECMAYALARALIKINPKYKIILAKFGLAGYDYRQK